MRIAILLIGLLALPAIASQSVWKWVDKDGVTHLSDRPVPGATKMEVSSGNRASAPAPQASSSAPVSEPVNTGPSYRNFEISKPANDQNFFNTGGQVTVSIRLEPALQGGHQLMLKLDGAAVKGFPRNTTQFELKDVSRGTHTAVAEILDSRGTRLQETAPVTFHVHQRSIASPPVGPAVNPPKPRN